MSSSDRPWKGVDARVLDAAGVTLCANGVARIPYRRLDGSFFRARFRAPSGRAWWGPGSGILPFGIETLATVRDSAAAMVFVAEGESDALALREAFAGASDGSVEFRAVGLPGALSWRPEWRFYVEQFPIVYLVGDGDEPGRQMIDRVVVDVPWARPVFLPGGEDCRSVLQRDGARAVDSLLADADWRVTLWAAWRLAGSLAELEALLRGEGLVRAA